MLKIDDNRFKMMPYLPSPFVRHITSQSHTSTDIYKNYQTLHEQIIHAPNVLETLTSMLIALELEIEQQDITSAALDEEFCRQLSCYADTVNQTS